MSPEDSKLLDLAAKHRRSLKRFKLFRRIDSSYLASTIVVTAAMVEVRFEKHSRSLSVLWILVVLGMPNSKKRMSTQRPPGHLLLSIAEFMMTKRTFEKVVVCSVLDMREEYFEALSQNRIWKARWVRVRGTYSIYAAIGLNRASAFVSFFIKAWKSVN